MAIVVVLALIIGAGVGYSAIRSPANTRTQTPTTATASVKPIAPSLSLDWKFGGSNVNGSLLPNGERYSSFYSFLSDGENVFAAAEKLEGTSSPFTGLGAYLIAVSLQYGRELWELKLPADDPKGSGLAFLYNKSSTNTLIVGVGQSLLSVDDRQGKVVWSVNDSASQGFLGFPLAASDGRIYTSTAAYDGRTGTKVCDYTRIGDIPSYGGGRVYGMIEGSSNGTASVVAVDGASCQTLWTTQLGVKGTQWPSYQVAYQGGVVYAEDLRHTYAIDSVHGGIIWNATEILHDGGSILTNFWPPTIMGNDVLVAARVGETENFVLEALDSRNGNPLWRSVLLNGTILRATASNGLAYVASGCDLFVLVDGGQVVWSSTSQGSTHTDACEFFWFGYFGPEIAGNFLILTDDISNLVVFRVATVQAGG